MKIKPLHHTPPKDGNNINYPNVIYSQENRSSLHHEVQTYQNSNILSTFSTFENRHGKNNCWFNSVLQVIIQALQQHQDDILAIPIPPENTYESVLFGMLQKFSTPHKYNVGDKIKDPTSPKNTMISLKFLMLKVMFGAHREAPIEENKQYDAGECIFFLLNKVDQLAILNHEVRDQFKCNRCNYTGLTDNPVRISDIEISNIRTENGRERFSGKDAIIRYFQSPEEYERSCDCGYPKSTKELILRNSPDYIFVQFKRFFTTGPITRSRKTEKINAELDFFSDVQINSLNNIDGNCQSVINEYKIIATIEHIGNKMENGHYQSYIFKNDHWVCCNDEELKQLPINCTDPIRNAYILLLKRMRTF